MGRANGKTKLRYINAGLLGAAGEGEGRERGDPEKRGKRGERAGGRREAGTKMSGLYNGEPLGEGKPQVWAGEFRVEGRVCQLYPAAGRDRTQWSLGI